MGFEKIKNLKTGLKIALAFCISILTSLLYSSNLTNILSDSDFTLTLESHFLYEADLQLYFDDGTGFNESNKLSQKVYSGKNRNTFEIKNKGVLKGIRFDFDSSKKLDTVRLLRVSLTSKNHNVLDINESEIIKNIKFLSPNLKTSNNRLLVIKQDNVDTYVILNSIFITKTSYFKRFLLFTLPFVMVFSIPFLSFVKKLFLTKNYNHLFLCLFIISIPLKESFSTLIILSWLVYSLIAIYKTWVFQFKFIGLIFVLLLIIPIVFGRTLEYQNINILLSFLIFTLISGNGIKIEKLEIFKFYFLFVLLLSAILCTAWLTHIFIFNDFDEISILTYFNNIKLVNFRFREWIPYSHPAFISCFILAGNLFANTLFRKGIIKTIDCLLINALSFCTISILGTRIVLLLYFILLGAFYIKRNLLLYYLGATFAIIAASLLIFISTIDPIRNQIWTVCYEAFQNKPFLGYGLGESRSIITDIALNLSAGFSEPQILNHPHNQIILYLLEIGLLGTIILISSIIYIYWKKIQLLSYEFLIVTFFWCCLSLVEAPFETSKPTLLFCFLFLITNTSMFKTISFTKK